MASPTETQPDTSYIGRVIVRLKEKLEAYARLPFRVGQQDATLEPLYDEVYLPDDQPDATGPVSLDSALDWLASRPWLGSAERSSVASHRADLRRSYAVTLPVGGNATAYVAAIRSSGTAIDKAWGRGKVDQPPSLPSANRVSVRDAGGGLRRGVYGPRMGVTAVPVESGLETMAVAAEPETAPAGRLRPRAAVAGLSPACLPSAGGRARRLRVVRSRHGVGVAAGPRSGLEIFTEPVGLPPGVEVETCYVLHDAPLPQTPCKPPSYHKAAGSLDIAAAKAAFDQLNPKVTPGAGVRVAVLERVGWQPGRNLLSRQTIPSQAAHYTPLEALDNSTSFNWDGDSSHTVKTLAVLDADACRGIAPAADVKCLSSLWRDAGGRWVTNLANSILNAVLHLRPGDILLIEQQGMDVTFLEQTQPFAPVEVDPAIWQAIRLATDVGIIVIEPAGNGSRAITLTGDSGAIVVGYCEAGPDRKRGAKSNHGARVDCFAWGDITLGGGLIYTGTSSAAAQIAGVAALLQSYYKARNSGKTLSPEQMRAALKYQGITASGPGIGVMPNLPAIVDGIKGGMWSNP